MMANLLFFTTWIIRFCRPSLHHTAFVFVLKLKVYTDLEQLYLQLCKISAAEENSVLLQCSTTFVLSQYSS